MLTVSTDSDPGQSQTLRHSEHAHLLSDIAAAEKLTLPIWGSLFPFWTRSPTGDLVCQLETTST